MIEIVNGNQKLSECEEMIMKVLWDAEEDLDLMQVTERVSVRFGKVWKIQTVATFMTRLKNKGWIEIYKIGRYSHYHPIVEIDVYREMKILEVFDLFATLSKEECIDAIRRLVDNAMEKIK